LELQHPLRLNYAILGVVAELVCSARNWCIVTVATVDCLQTIG
jgi:hypothetical protein